jgi:hypothetical protein
MGLKRIIGEMQGVVKDFCGRPKRQLIVRGRWHKQEP